MTDDITQVWIDIDENENCGYFPMQVFEVRGVERVAERLLLEDVNDVDGRCEIVGWSDTGRCEIRVVPVGDSGSGESLLVHGGNHGIRLRPELTNGDWSLDASCEFGEPYMLLPSETVLELIGTQGN